MKDIKTWWGGLAQRDRRILLIGLGLALPLLGYLLLWQPLAKARDTARAAHAETAAQHAEIKQLAAQLKARPASQAAPANGTTSPLAAVEAVAREQRLLDQLKRREAEGANGVRLTLEEAPADALMRLLEALEQRHGLHVGQAQIDPASPGKVNAQISLNLGPGRNKG